MEKSPTRHQALITLLYIDTNIGYLYGTIDPDGIAGHNTNTQLEAYMSEGKMHIDIKK
jgi:hypothetical protein